MISKISGDVFQVGRCRQQHESSVTQQAVSKSSSLCTAAAPKNPSCEIHVEHMVNGRIVDGSHSIDPILS